MAAFNSPTVKIRRSEMNCKLICSANCLYLFVGPVLLFVPINFFYLTLQNPHVILEAKFARAGVLGNPLVIVSVQEGSRA